MIQSPAAPARARTGNETPRGVRSSAAPPLPATWAELVQGALPEHTRRAAQRVVARVLTRLEATGSPTRAGARAAYALLAEALRQREELWHAVDRVEATLRASNAFGAGSFAVTELARQLEALSVASDLAESPWLDASAIEDHCALARHQVDQHLEVLASVVGALPARGEPAATALGRALARAMAGPGPWTTRVAMIRAYGALSLGGAAPSEPLAALASAHHEDPWVQAEALRVLCPVDPDLGTAIAAATLTAGVDAHPDHRLARARAAEVLASLGAFDVLRDALERTDPSEHVRIAVARALAESLDPEHHDAIVWRLADGAHPDGWRVGVAGSLTLIDVAADRPAIAAGGLRAVLGALNTRPAPEAARTLLDAVWTRLRARKLDRVAYALRAAEEVWTRFTAAEVEPDTRRLASAIRVHLRLTSAAATDDALRLVSAAVANTDEGASVAFTDGPVASLSARQLLDILFVVAQDELDLSADPVGDDDVVSHPGLVPSGGWIVHVGNAVERAPWRAMHELGHPRNDKRQAVAHTVDELPRGRLIAWSARMSEVATTDVPGRRVATPSSLAWGEHLPLPANLVVAARKGAVRLRTAEGDVVLRAESRFARVQAQRRYVGVARLRGDLAGLPQDHAVQAWDAHITSAGFSVDRQNWSLSPLAFFGAAPAQASWELGALAVGAVAGWAVMQGAREARLRRWRASLPLVIGGWGSRGKSSVERMKAALFHGLGYTVLCKSTGCEAMLLHAIPGRPAVETYLYRPRDKATIVEQHDVLRMAAGIGAQVTLYECMALNPFYTHILQHAWMHDDLTTITNTYPDHEDIQGPSGRDVADVISVFVPSNGRLVTSEQHMTPVLRRRANMLGTTADVVGPEDWALLPRDLLARFPDEAYDRNVALVVQLARALGVRDDVALRAMADHVLVDLGAFKRYGPLPVDGRSFTFWNGCSANDRASFLSNWQRAGLEALPQDAGRGDHLVVMFNNRADRLARQAIFARIAALEVDADAIVLIGTNVAPMADQIVAALRDVLVPQLQALAAGPAGRPGLRAHLARRLRRPADAPDDPKAPEAWRDDVTWLRSLTGDFDVDAAIAAFVERFARRVVPLRDPGLSGDEVMSAIVALFPPGARVTTLGAENIKGTGLDVVYRQVAADRVLGWLGRARGRDVADARVALHALAGNRDWGVHVARHAEATLRKLLDGGAAARAGIADEVAAALASASRATQPKERDASQQGWRGVARRWWRQVDLVSAVGRRARADALMRAIAGRRIGLSRAAAEIRALVEQDKP